MATVYLGLTLLPSRSCPLDISEILYKVGIAEKKNLQRKSMIVTIRAMHTYLSTQSLGRFETTRITTRND